MRLKMWKLYNALFGPETNEVVRVVLPQAIIIMLLICYVLFGSFMFMVLDPVLRKQNFSDMVLFSFTTLATIGYGNISPSTPQAQLFCIAFSIFGIPMTLLILANLGKYLTKAYWMTLVCLGKEIRWRACENAKMPLPTILTLFAITFAFGSLLFYHKGKGFCIDDVYFGVISFATVGFGDKFPTADDPIRLIGMIFYLVWGMILMTTMFSVVSGYLRAIHYLGRRLRGARDVHVWFGGKSMKVAKLLEIVADEFDASPRELRRVLRELDNLITAAIQENPILSTRSSVLFKRHSLKKRIGFSLQEGFPEQEKNSRYNLLKAMDPRSKSFDHSRYRLREAPIEEEVIVNRSFFKERQAIDRSQSVDLGELNRRTITKYQI